MNPFVPLLLGLQLLSAQPLAAPVPSRSGDRWFAEDKMKHLLTSMAAVGFAHSGARIVSLDGNRAVLAAAAAGAAAGIWKEFHDKSVGKPFSFRDLTWDALGIGIGVILVSQAR